MAEHLSKLELERLERINENKRRMQEIGLGEAAAAIRASQAQPAPSQNGPKRKRVYERILISEEDLRRSDRSRKDVNYNEQQFYKQADAALRGASRQRTYTLVKSKAGGGKASVRVRGWNFLWGCAGHDAQKRCQEAALDCAEGLDNPACLKVMSASMVSGGFWCSAPQELVKLVGETDKCTLTAYLPEGQQLPENAAYANGEAWDIVWLPHGNKGTSYGFSGNWAGFAIDMGLFPGDVVVCEVLPAGHPRRAEATRFSLVFHVHRAIDYETEGQRAARLAATEDAQAAAAAEKAEEDGSEGQQQPAGAAAVAELSEQGQQEGEEEEEEGGAAADDELGEGFAAAERAGGSKRRRLSPQLAEEGPAAGAAVAKVTKAAKRAAAVGKGKGKSKAPVGGRKAAVAAARSRKAAAAGGASSGALLKRQGGAAAARKKTQSIPPAAAAAMAKKEAAAAKTAPAPAAAAAKKAAAAAKRAAREQAAAVKTAQKQQGKERTTDEGEGEEGEEEEGYEVESILEVKGRGKGRRLHIKWVGYEETTWESISMLDQPLATYQLAEGIKP